MLYQLPPEYKKPRRWQCKCSCGTERALTKQKLVEGHSKSCGCGDRHNLVSGQTFGHWTVLYKLPRRKQGNIQWWCKCICGTERAITGHYLVTGLSDSCGCVGQYYLAGRKFGRLYVLPEHKPKMRGHYRVWKCRCDCGTIKWITGTRLLTGHTKSCGCYALEMRRKSRNAGADHPNWKGGRTRDSSGYIHVLCKGHPAAIRNYVPEHRVKMEAVLGRYLLPGETVHHRNGIRDDNEYSNLELWSTRHPKGSRVSDLLIFAKEVIKLYGKQPRQKK